MCIYVAICIVCRCMQTCILVPSTVMHIHGIIIMAYHDIACLALLGTVWHCVALCRALHGTAQLCMAWLVCSLLWWPSGRASGFCRCATGHRRSVWPGTSRRAGTVRIGWERRSATWCVVRRRGDGAILVFFVAVLCVLCGAVRAGLSCVGVCWMSVHGCVLWWRREWAVVRAVFFGCRWRRVWRGCRAEQ